MIKLKKLFEKYFKIEQMPYQEKYEKDISKDLETTISRKKQLEEEYEEVKNQPYIKITEEEIEDVEELLDKHKKLVEKQNLYRVKLVKFGETMKRIAENEHAIEADLKEMRDTHRRLKMCESDLIYLEGEEKSASSDRKFFINLYKTIKLMLQLISIGAMISAIPFTYLLSTGAYNEVYRRYSVIAMLIVFIGIGILVFGKRVIEKALEKNEEVIKNIYKYIHKVKIREVHTANSLKNELAKYCVESVAAIEVQYNRYKKNKHHFAKYQQMSANVFECELDILDKLEPYGVITFKEVRTWLKEAKSGKAQFAVKNYEKSLEELQSKINQLQQELQ